MLQADTEGFTDLAMQGQQQQPVTNLYAEFYMSPVKDDAKTIKEGRPIYEEKQYIKIMVPGDKTTIIQRPVRIGHTPEHDNIKFGAQYEAFKRGADQTLDGTPLKEWPLISQSQVRELEFFHVRTVEQLASMSDTNTQNFAGILALREQAKAFIKAAKDSSHTVQLQDELKKRDELISAQGAQIASMIDEMTEMKKKRSRKT